MSPAAEATNALEWSVSELAGALKRTLEDAFGHVRLRAELGKVNRHSSGHIYLDLKDDGACIAGVIWRNAAGRLRVKLEQGMEVVATGRITTFPGQSKYQIVIDTIEPAGIGALMALIDERRRRLAAEGLFAEGRKRRPPFLPGVIGVVTSPTGAVIHDILHRLEDRFARHVVVWPVRVQGETCGAEVAAAIAGLNALPAGGAIARPDVIIVARGGGSVEDLWGFNDEAVVRAAAASTIPLISAVGHETDWTLIDHAADLRAPTPTGAAELAVPVRSELLSRLTILSGRQAASAQRLLDARRSELRSAARALPTPDALFASRRQRLDLGVARLGPALGDNTRRHGSRVKVAADGLGRHTPRIELAGAKASLRQVGRTPLDVMVGRVVERKATALASLSDRLAAGRDAVKEAERLKLARCRERVGGLGERGSRALHSALGARTARVASLGQLLGTLGYRSVLERGFALVRDGDGRAVRRAEQATAGDALTVEFADGRRFVRVEGAEASALPSPPPARPKRRTTGLVQESLFDM